MNVMQINGITIETDKNSLSSKGGSVFKFGDGSTYDHRTGVFKNKGRGYVKVNGKLLQDGENRQPVANNNIVTKSYIYDGIATLLLDSSSAAITVEKHDKPTVHITMTGFEDDIELVELASSGTVLSVNDKSGGSNGGNIVISSKGSINISNFSMSSGDSATLDIAILVPEGMPISATSANGNITINNVNGPLVLNASISGDIEATGARGTVRASASTSGDIELYDCDLELLQADASTSGDISMTGTTKRAALSASTSGDIKVEHTQDTPQIQESTSGRVRVHAIG